MCVVFSVYVQQLFYLCLLFSYCFLCVCLLFCFLCVCCIVVVLFSLCLLFFVVFFVFVALLDSHKSLLFEGQTLVRKKLKCSDDSKRTSLIK